MSLIGTIPTNSRDCDHESRGAPEAREKRHHFARALPPTVIVAGVNAREIGRRGEEAVAAALVRAGAIIVSRNARVSRAEVDILATRRDQTLAVEVKSALAGSLAAEELALRLTPRQLARVRWAATRLASERGLPTTNDLRILGALVTVPTAQGEPTIEWLDGLDDSTLRR